MKNSDSHPVHVAIIMDGNGRWARNRHLPRQAGHIGGIAALRRVVEAARNVGLRYLTLYAFSTENWRRPKAEIANLMGLLRQYFHSDVERLKNSNVRIRVIGAREGLDPDIAQMVEASEKMTAGNTGLNLTFAFNYGAREEIVSAARRLAAAAAKGSLDPTSITPETFAAELQTSGLPDPDLIVRTSGEQRLSNFLLWQTAYSEFVFLDTLWPDFSEADLRNALEEFARRRRRFGGVDQDEDQPVAQSQVIAKS